MSAPTKFGRCDAFFVEAINTPRVDKLVDFFWLVGDLRVALGDVNHLCASEHCKLVELPIGKCFFQTSFAIAGKTLVENLGSNFSKGLLDEMAHESRVGTMFKNGGGATVATPCLNHLAQRLMTHVQSAIKWMGCGHVLIRIPQLNRGIEVANAVLMTPREDCWCVNIPCKVKQHVAIRQSCGQELIEIFRSNAADFITHALCNEISNAVTVIKEVNNRDARGVNLYVSNQKGECALSNTATTQNEDATGDERCDRTVNGYQSPDERASARRGVVPS